MFLQKVYKHSKLLFLAMLGFIAGQLFINYKHGVVCSPFYHYGMYSEVMKVKDKYQVWEIEVNGKKLFAKDYSIQQWDMIMLPLQYYEGIQKSNALYETDIKRLLGKVHISADEKYYLNNCRYDQFEKWYSMRLQQLTKMPVNSLIINYRTYLYKGDHFVSTDEVISLAQLCS